MGATLHGPWFDDRGGALDIHVVGKHVEIPSEVKAAALDKLKRVERLASDTRRIDLDFGEIHGRRADERYTCELIVHVKKHRLDAHSSGPTLTAAFDKALHKVEHQLHKLHDRRVEKPLARREGGPGHEVLALALESP